LHPRGSIVFTAFLWHSLHPIIFLEIVKEQQKIKTSIASGVFITIGFSQKYPSGSF